MDDFLRFDWDWVQSLPSKMGWNELSSNLLLVGMAGNVTPAHYDEQQNLLAQLVGRKRVVLFPPKDWRGLYPFPLHHPHDRQSQVDFFRPDLDRFPRLSELTPIECILHPGDVVFIPQYWWHHIENLDDGCTSVTFWYKDTAPKNVQVRSRSCAAKHCPLTTSRPFPSRAQLPLTDKQEIALLRNLERIMAESAGLANAHDMFRRIASGAELTEADNAVVSSASTLLAHVLPGQREIDAFIHDMAAGRFW